ncbi:MAG: DUF4919 domain-containing protein [Bacteroidetes bacterium]|nr:DUF4919 domain-containing protein [Bacteroidota bacterium]
MYSPYSSFESTMMDTVLKSLDKKNPTKAMGFINAIHDKNFCYIKSHLYAFNIYKELMDTVRYNFHKYVYNELLKSIEQSDTGKNERNAYFVIAVNEEYAFMRWNGFRLVQQSLVSKDNFSFDLMELTIMESNCTNRFDLVLQNERAVVFFKQDRIHYAT